MGDHLREAEVLARSLGDQHRLAQIAVFMSRQTFGQEALTIGRTLGDRSIEVGATWFLGNTHVFRGEYSEAAKLLEQNLGLEGKLRAERLGTNLILSAASEYVLCGALHALGQFDEAIEHAEAAVRIAEEFDHPWTLFWGLFHFGLVHLIRGDFPRAVRFLERSLDIGRTWQYTGHRRDPWPRLWPCWPD
jgi:tetratricopeptide (TPR) repeat protein